MYPVNSTDSYCCESPKLREVIKLCYHKTFPSPYNALFLQGRATFDWIFHINVILCSKEVLVLFDVPSTILFYCPKSINNCRNVVT